MDKTKMYAYITDMGEGCFSIEIFCDGSKGRVSYWSNGDELAPEVDQPEDHSEVLEDFVYWNANFSRLIKFCRRVLRLSNFGYVDEVPVSFCFR